jgi:DNA-binding CsgD family transcriptional regulator
LHRSSLDAPAGGQPGGDSLADLLGEEDPRVEHMLAMQAVAAHWAELAPREQRVLLLRFHGDMTQVQIGRKLGMSQMQVSRLLARALGYLRPRLLGQHEHASGRQPGRHRAPREGSLTRPRTARLKADTPGGRARGTVCRVQPES